MNWPTFQGCYRRTRRLFIAVMMEVISAPETSTSFHQTTRRNIPKDSHLYTRHIEYTEISLTENCSAHRRFIKTLGRTSLDEWSAHRKGLYLHRTTKLRNTETNIHASSEIRTHDPNNQAAETYTLDSAATGTDRTIQLGVWESLF
jgi:hypothetical protein